jgi:hypothetical protein
MVDSSKLLVSATKALSDSKNLLDKAEKLKADIKKVKSC